MIDLALALVLALPLPTSTVAAARAQDPNEKLQLTDERPEVKALVDELAADVKARGEKDLDAIGVLDKLVQEFPNCGPKDRVAVVGAVGDCFDAKRVKELEEGIPDDRLFKAAAVTLGQMAPESVKKLISLIGDKNHRKNSSLQQQIALSLGKTKHPEGVKVLMALLKHKDAPMQAAGAEALANYFEADLETRKLIFEDLLRTMMDQKTKKDGNVSDLEAQERWNTISGPILSTLQKLSGHSETDPEQWQRWWNDNKKKDWGAKAE